MCNWLASYVASCDKLHILTVQMTAEFDEATSDHNKSLNELKDSEETAKQEVF